MPTVNKQLILSAGQPMVGSSVIGLPLAVDYRPRVSNLRHVNDKVVGFRNTHKCLMGELLSSPGRFNPKVEKLILDNNRSFKAYCYDNRLMGKLPQAKVRSTVVHTRPKYSIEDILLMKGYMPHVVPFKGEDRIYYWRMDMQRSQKKRLSDALWGNINIGNKFTNTKIKLMNIAKQQPKKKMVVDAKGNRMGWDATVLAELDKFKRENVNINVVEIGKTNNKPKGKMLIDAKGDKMHWDATVLAELDKFKQENVNIKVVEVGKTNKKSNLNGIRLPLPKGVPLKHIGSTRLDEEWKFASAELVESVNNVVTINNPKSKKYNNGLFGTNVVKVFGRLSNLMLIGHGVRGQVISGYKPARLVKDKVFYPGYAFVSDNYYAKGTPVFNEFGDLFGVITNARKISQFKYEYFFSGLSKLNKYTTPLVPYFDDNYVKCNSILGQFFENSDGLVQNKRNLVGCTHIVSKPSDAFEMGGWWKRKEVKTISTNSGSVNVGSVIGDCYKIIGKGSVKVADTKYLVGNVIKSFKNYKSGTPVYHNSKLLSLVNESYNYIEDDKHVFLYVLTDSKSLLVEKPINFVTNCAHSNEGTRRRRTVEKMTEATIQTAKLAGEVSSLSKQLNALSIVANKATVAQNNAMYTSNANGPSVVKKRNKAPTNGNATFMSSLLIVVLFAILSLTVGAPQDPSTVTQKPNEKSPSSEEFAKVMNNLRQFCVEKSDLIKKQNNNMFNTCNDIKKLKEDINTLKGYHYWIQNRMVSTQTTEYKKFVDLLTKAAEDLADKGTWEVKYGYSKEKFLHCTGGKYLTPESLDEVSSWEINTPFKGCSERYVTSVKLVDCLQTWNKTGKAVDALNKEGTKCIVFHKCETDVNSMANLISNAIGSVYTVKDYSNINQCKAILEKIEIDLVNVKHYGHAASINIVESAKSKACVPDELWKHKGHLGGNNNNSCASGVSLMSLESTSCQKVEVDNCFNKPGHECQLGWSNTLWKGKQLLTNINRLNKQECCTIQCFSMQQAYESFTNQPLCSNCVKLFTNIFWNVPCKIDDDQEITSIDIFKKKTVFHFETVDSLECGNRFDFHFCCAGEGAVETKNKADFKDKYCMCSANEKKWYERFANTFKNVITNTIFEMHVVIIIGLLTLALFSKNLAVLMAFVYILHSIYMVHGACSIEQMVPIEMTTFNTNMGLQFEKVRVREGNCFTVGDSTVEIVSIKDITDFNFLKSVPYKLKAACQVMDWGCTGGKSDKVYTETSECYDTCVPGLRVIVKDRVVDWSGDGCLINTMIPTRIDVCVSHGAYSTFEEIYTRLTSKPITQITVKYHGIGFERTDIIVESNIGEDQPVRMFDVSTPNTYWPTMIAHRLGVFMCSFHYVETSKLCSSSNVYKPNEIDVDCLKLTKHWDATNGGYVVDFANNDFTQILDQFQLCSSSDNVVYNATTITYSSVVPWADISVKGQFFKFGESVPMCSSSELWTATSDPGVTGMHKSTVITYTNNGQKCRLLAKLDGCTSTNGNLIILGGSDKTRKIEYWCRGNSTGVLTLTDNKWNFELKLKVQTNFLPHKNSLRTMFDKVIRVSDVDSIPEQILGAFQGFDLTNILSPISGLFVKFKFFSITKWVVGIVCGLLSYTSFVRGNILMMIVWISIGWLIVFTDFVLAISPVMSREHNNGLINTLFEVVALIIVLITTIVRVITVSPYVLLRSILCIIRLQFRIIMTIKNIVTEQLIELIYDIMLCLISCVQPLFGVFVISYITVESILENTTMTKQVQKLKPGMSIITGFLKDEVDEDPTEVGGPYTTVDSLVTNKANIYSELKMYYCGDVVEVIEIPIEFMCSSVGTWRTKYGTFYFIQQQDGEFSVYTARHCVVDDEEEDTFVCIVGDKTPPMEIDDTAFISEPAKKGMSGTLCKIDDEYKFLSGVCEKKNVYKSINNIQFIPIHYVFSSTSDCVILRNDVMEEIGALCEKHGVELRNGKVVFDKTILLQSSTQISEKEGVNFVDFAGRNYRFIAEKGLISQTFRARHVCSEGFVVANDTMCVTRGTKFSIISRYKSVYVSSYDISTNTGNKLCFDIDNCSVCVSGSEDKIVNEISVGNECAEWYRLERTPLFKCDENLISGMLIYQKAGGCMADWLSSDYQVVGVVTQSVKINGKNFYTIYNSGNEMLQVKMVKKIIQTKGYIDTASVGDVDTHGYNYRTIGNHQYIELVNKGGLAHTKLRSKYNLIQANYVNHSPSQGEYSHNDGVKIVSEDRLNELIPALDLKVLRNFLILDVKPDGSCLFHALAEGLKSFGFDLATGEKLRNLCIKSGRSQLMDKVEWGDSEIDGQIISNYFNIPIVIIEVHISTLNPGERFVVFSSINPRAKQRSQLRKINLKSKCMYIINPSINHWWAAIRKTSISLVERLNPTNGDIRFWVTLKPKMREQLSIINKLKPTIEEDELDKSIADIKQKSVNNVEKHVVLADLDSCNHCSNDLKWFKTTSTLLSSGGSIASAIEWFKNKGLGEFPATEFTLFLKMSLEANKVPDSHMTTILRIISDYANSLHVHTGNLQIVLRRILSTGYDNSTDGNLNSFDEILNSMASNSILETPRIKSNDDKFLPNISVGKFYGGYKSHGLYKIWLVESQEFKQTEDKTSVCIQNQNENLLIMLNHYYVRSISNGSTLIEVDIRQVKHIDTQQLLSVLELKHCIGLITFVHIIVDDTHIKNKLIREINKMDACALCELTDRKDWVHKTNSPMRYKLGKDVDFVHFEKSLAKWNNTQSAEDHTSVQILRHVTNTEEDIDSTQIDKEKIYVGRIQNMLTRGSYFIYKQKLYTSEHVTHGNPVHLNLEGCSYTYKKSNVLDSVGDICVYGGSAELSGVNENELVVAYNRDANFAQLYFVQGTSETIQGKGDCRWSKLIPCSTYDQRISVVKIGYRFGMSGSPIFNMDGKPVGIFGNAQSKVIANDGYSIDTAVHCIVNGAANLQHSHFFRKCAENLFNWTGNEAAQDAYLNLPTGTGKSTIFPMILAGLIEEKNISYRVLILQPNVLAVKNGFNRVKATMHDIYNLRRTRISFEVGQQNIDSSEICGNNDDYVCSLDYKTYGKLLANDIILSRYNLIIMDECHMISDATVVTTLIVKSTRFPKLKTLKMSATHIGECGGYDIAEGDTIGGTKKEIREITWEVGDNKATSGFDGSELIITKDIIRNKIRDTVRIDKRYVEKGLVLFMCASKNDCEKGAAWGKSLGVQSWAYHSGIDPGILKQISSHVGSGWVFGTNILQQSITIPNLSVLVDFGMEMKPHVSCTPLSYCKELRPTVISNASAIQRKGRVGRTIEGVYVRPPINLDSVIIDKSIIPEVCIRLKQAKISLDTIRCERLLKEEIVSYSWILDGSEIAPNVLIDRMGRVEKFDVDLVKWSLRKIIPRKEYEFYLNNESKDVSGPQLVHELNWLHVMDEKDLPPEYKSYCYSDPFERSRLASHLRDDDINVMSFQELEEQLQQQGNSLYYSVVIASVLGASYSIVTKLIDNKTDRFITSMTEITASNVIADAKHIIVNKIEQSAEICNIYSYLHHLSGQTNNTIREFVTNYWFGQNKKCSASEIEDYVSVAWNWVYDNFHRFISDDPNFGLVCGAFSLSGILGTLFSRIETLCGRAVAIPLYGTVYGFIQWLFGFKYLCATAAVGLASQIISIIIKGAPDTKFGTKPENAAGSIWTHVSSVLLGGGLSRWLTTIGLVSAASSKIETRLMAVSPTRGGIGLVGAPVLIIKYIYRLINGEINTVSIASTTLSVLSLVTTIGPMSLVYAGGCAVGLFAIKMIAESVIDSYARKDACGNQQHFEERKKSVRKMIDNLINSMAIVVYPASLISVAIGAVGQMLRGSGMNMQKVFDDCSGVPPIVKLLEEIFIVIFQQRSTVNMSEFSIGSVIGVLIDTFVSVSSFLSGYYGRIRNFMTDLLTHFKNLIGKLTYYVKTCLAKTGNFLGRNLASGMVQNLRNNSAVMSMVLSEQKPTTDCIERISYSLHTLTKHETYFYEQYKKKGYLSPCQTIWSKLKPSSEMYFRLEDLKNQLNKVIFSSVTIMQTDCDAFIDLFKLNKEDLGHYLTTTFDRVDQTGGEININCLVMKHDISIGLSIHNPNDETVMGVGVIKNQNIGGFVVQIKKAENGCQITLLLSGLLGYVSTPLKESLEDALDVGGKWRIFEKTERNEFVDGLTRDFGLNKPSTFQVVTDKGGKIVSGAKLFISQIVASDKDEVVLNAKLFHNRYERLGAILKEVKPWHWYWNNTVYAAAMADRKLGNRGYYNPKWNYPNGVKPKILPGNLDSIPDCEWCEMVYGIKLREPIVAWLNTPIINLTVELYTTYLAKLCCFNNFINCRVIRNINGVIQEELSADSYAGAQTLILYYDDKGSLFYNCLDIFDKLTFDEAEAETRLFAADTLLELNEDQNNWKRVTVDKREAIIMPHIEAYLLQVDSDVGLINERGKPSFKIQYGSEKLVKSSDRFSLIDSISSFFRTDAENMAIKIAGNNMLERVNYLFVRNSLDKELANKMKRDQENIDEEFFDATQYIDYDCLVGFDVPTRGSQLQWSWHKTAATHHITEDLVMNLYKRLHSIAMKKTEWEKMKNAGRYELPMRVQKMEEGLQIKAQSRAFYKMQQLYEADTSFFENCEVILDPCCGYGGFEQFFSIIFKDKTPRMCLTSSLLEKGHRVPDFNSIQVDGSNFKVVNLCKPHVDNGNIRDLSVQARIRTASQHLDGVSLLILDFGEFYQESKKQCQWYTGETPKLLTIQNAILQLQENLRKGGKMLLKWCGYFKGGLEILFPILNRFKNIKAMKVGTCSKFSTEFYIFASGYSGKPVLGKAKLKDFYGSIGDRIYESLSDAQMCIYQKRRPKVLQRNDWLQPTSQTIKYCDDLKGCGRPGRITVKTEYCGTKLEKDWDPDWDNRLSQFHYTVRKLYGETKTRKLRYIQGNRGTYKNIFQDGYFIRPSKPGRLKKSKDALLSNMLFETYGLTALNSVVGQTQNTSNFTEASIKKRLDVVAPRLDGDILGELRHIAKLMTSEYGRSLLGKGRLLTEEETFIALNKSGATSILSQFGNLRDFCTRVPDWYNVCMKYCVEKWIKGESTHTFFNIMHKNEPKVKKNVVNGNIVLEKGSRINYEHEELIGELDSYCYLPHRYIQYADEISRISHYIVLGWLIEHGSHQKLYKGTINGTPPFHQGNILRAVYDLNVYNPDDRVFNCTHRKGVPTGHVNNAPIEVDMLIDNDLVSDEDKPAVISIDYSGWDSTVSVGERMIESDWIQQFYPQKLYSCIDNCLREMSFGVCLDHEGNLILREGQRGSGEIVTSIGNTLLVMVNTLRAIHVTTSIPYDELCSTIAIVRYQLKSYVKMFEITCIPQFSDGDDTVILTTLNVANLISKNIDDVLAEAGKSIRSGTKSGCSISTRFEDLDFCSHHYELTIVGVKASFVHVPSRQYINCVKRYPDMYRIYHLPTRPTTEILGKMRATLKQIAQTENVEVDGENTSTSLTRSKLMSYMLMYPHMRHVRFATITGLAIVGDGNLDFKEMSRRYPELKDYIDNTTLAGCLNSVYGVRSLDDISLRDHRLDHRDSKAFENHALLDGKRRSINLRQLTIKAVGFMISYKRIHSHILSLDSKYLKRVVEVEGSHRHLYNLFVSKLDTINLKHPISVLENISLPYLVGKQT